MHGAEIFLREHAEFSFPFFPLLAVFFSSLKATCTATTAADIAFKNQLNITHSLIFILKIIFWASRFIFSRQTCDRGRQCWLANLAITLIVFITSHGVKLELNSACRDSCCRGGLKNLKVIYRLDFRQQLLITATHIWIYSPFVSRGVLLAAIIISALLHNFNKSARKCECKFDGNVKWSWSAPFFFHWWRSTCGYHDKIIQESINPATWLQPLLLVHHRWWPRRKAIHSNDVFEGLGFWRKQSVTEFTVIVISTTTINTRKICT